MHGKALLLLAILAEIPASLASQKDNALQSEMNCNNFTPAACVTRGRVHGPFQLQHVLAYANIRDGNSGKSTETDCACFELETSSEVCGNILAFAKCLEGLPSAGEADEVCNMDQDCIIQLVECPHESMPDKDRAGGPLSQQGLLARSTPDQGFSGVVVVPAGKEDSEQLRICDVFASAMPGAVQQAMLNGDPNVVAQSLAEEFSGNVLPQ
ncbi:hypothetical protein HRR83_006736 [Exophiala dermatitidis]|uniref:Extracellular membrane protein CFEM domain-containing protein n=2 Tax=Exophiala dermatitidis TaxID=5970 RepID=H6BVE9_EXODN|nr:uncharacterized protein HMPREF1120_03993 [Exophiala dermatitidis NIH/UT8656]KAJ4514237.1 hypothetical protein HRR74_005896 [Exophiala dermatitidis]EHY55879.1 hypothetical protein HMPREF1120_03993 [Exophiala dermatitidis NIH/UT8656]KAJ4515279.1 hypothetical protein HRR73_005110 [Exophiala dermatitidis]KAJ4535316.1 hypothetical protein HRR77_007934 [Exophiala dermatitidis]KAJ4540804.1 hypothetical protein HRR76_004189 [Exophiala dermatitidis]